MSRIVKIYRNDDVEEIVAAIPRNHYHVRLLIRLKDQDIVLHEAVLAAITRAYLSIILHPTKRGVILVKKRFSSNEKKPGYASIQLVEKECSEKEAVNIISDIISGG
ncbi:MAG: hypothetical protein B6U89_06200 [Desulfurococcales archaeon ex4484_58]|nr:MAG: hypothetical protein B6U89_06200 [Desulfurococcales archaeon ex4484_58]